MPNPFAEQILLQPPPRSFAADVSLPRRQQYHPSPGDWRNEVLYFLLVDRFSDGAEAGRPLVNRNARWSQRPDVAPGQAWRWDKWAESGAFRWQGGTLAGVASKLDYLSQLGVSTLWLSPVFRQRAHLDTFHGYGIQNFLEVDPRFGTRAELVSLVEQAHARGLRIILDIIFNHSGANWVYPDGEFQPAYRQFPAHYPFGNFLDGTGGTIAGQPALLEEGVWPVELQAQENYTRAGFGSLGAGGLEDPHAEHKRTDFFTLRDFALDTPGVLQRLMLCYQYWIALTDCDGFRIDTLKHVSFEEGRNFCGGVKEFAANLGKSNFLLVGEVAGGDFAQERYLEVLGQNLDATLDIGEMRPTLAGVAKGLQAGGDYFSRFVDAAGIMGSHRALGSRHVSILDDHDHVFGRKLRFSSEAGSDRQVVAATALQLFSLGIPCIYYGTEQALAGPEPSERNFLPGWGGGDHADRYLREAMFGPSHPRPAGSGSEVLADRDQDLPGFGPFGTAGAQCFDPAFHVYQSLGQLTALRAALPVLRQGRQYLRPISNFGGPFVETTPGEIIPWSRILSDEEALCVVNAHGNAARGGDVVVDANLNPPGSRLTVVLNTALQGGLPVGSSLPVLRRADGTAFVEIRDLPPSEVVVLTNHP